MPIDLSIDKVVSTTSLNVTTDLVDPKIDYFSKSVFLQTYLSTPSPVFTSSNTPEVSVFSDHLNYVNFFNLYFDIPYNLYQGFPNLLDRISIRVLPATFSLSPAYSFVPASKDLLIKSEIITYPYHEGFSYIYLSSEGDINCLNEQDDLILAWNSSNNRLFQYLPEELPPELPSNPGGGASGLKEFWA